MTPERKDQLFQKMLSLIGVHLSEDGDVNEGLRELLDLTDEEMTECGLSFKGAEPDAKTRLMQKVKDCFEAYKNEWLGKSPATLIEEAEEIAAMQRMTREMPKTVTEEDAAYLLRFQNPLEVVSDYWQEENNSPVAENDRLTYILWEITDKQAAEQDYALEPEFQQSEPSQTQQQTM